MKKLLKMIALLTVLTMVLSAGAAAFASPLGSLIELIGELTEYRVPESAGQLVQKNLYQETVNNVEITVLEAAYDGRSLFLEYSYRMLDVDHPLGITAAEMYGDEQPEDVASNDYVYGLSDDGEEQLYVHNVGWWQDNFWIDGTPLDDMPDGSGQYITGTAVPGELIETDIWRLDNVGVSLEGKVQISLPIGDRQDYMDYRDGRLPDKGVITFEFDAGDTVSALRVFHPEGETVVPVATVKVRETVFSPMLTYIRMDLSVEPEVLEAFIAENGEGYMDDDGELLWPYGPMDVFGEWIESLTLTDGSGTVLFPDTCGPEAYSDEEAEFLCPYLETVPEALYLAPVDENGVADMSQAVPVI